MAMNWASFGWPPLRKGGKKMSSMGGSVNFVAHSLTIFLNSSFRLIAIPQISLPFPQALKPKEPFD
jgi:hypothetical protein